MQMGSCAAAPEDGDAEWATSAVAVAQDVASVLVPASDDTQPVCDAARYEALCARSHAACAAAAGATGALTPKSLAALQQLCDRTLQLASAVCCNPDVAAHLIAAGSHAGAIEQLKGGVKALSSLLTRSMEALAQQDAGPQQQQQQQQEGSAAWLRQGLLQAVRGVLLPLQHMALTAAAFVSASSSGGGSTPSSALPHAAPPAAAATLRGSQQQQQQQQPAAMPKEMCSMTVLNLSWSNLTSLLVAVPPGCQARTLAAAELLPLLGCALSQLQAAVQELPQRPKERQKVLLKFWLQAAARLTGAAAVAAPLEGLQQLLAAALGVYACSEREEYASSLDVLEQVLLKQRLQACIGLLLAAAPADAATLQRRFDCLLARPAGGGSSSDGTQLQCQAHLLLVLDLMQQLPSMAEEVVTAGASSLLGWVLTTGGSGLATLILASELGGPALQHLLQTCLHCVVGCACTVPQHLPALLQAMTTLALAEHPLVAFLAQQLLADVLACSSPELVQQQLGLLHELLEDAAALAAVPAASASLHDNTHQLVSTLAAVLQGCQQDITGAWLAQALLRPNSGLAAATAGSAGGWLDAAGCALLVCHCELLQCLGPAAALPPSHGTAQLSEALQKLWLTAHQVSELLRPPHPAHQQGDKPGAAAAEQLLVLHQLTWLLEAMAAAMQLLQARSAAAGGTAAPGSALLHSCAGLAVDVLLAVEGSRQQQGGARGGSAGAAGAPPDAAAAACCTAVLKVLGSAGQLPPNEGLELLMQQLQQLPAGQQGLLAAVCGNLACAAGMPAHEELFQQLLSSRHWAVRHSAFEGLVRLLRHQDCSARSVVRLLPPFMRSSATEASPGVIQVIKAHVTRQPDAQAQQAFQSSYEQLAAQHSSALCGLGNGGSCLAALAAGPDCHLAAGKAQLEAAVVRAQASSTAAAAAVGAAAALQAGAGAAPPLSAPAHALMQLTAAAHGSLNAADKALAALEGDVRALVCSASAAAHAKQLAAEEVAALGRQGASLAGGAASLCSRLRALQDALSQLRG